MRPTSQITSRQQPSERLLHDALSLAVAVRANDPLEVAAQLAAVIHPSAMMLALASLIDVDGPLNRWWERPQVDDDTPCRLCKQPLGSRPAGSRIVYHPTCRIAARRASWRASQDRRSHRTNQPDTCDQISGGA